MKPAQHLCIFLATWELPKSHYGQGVPGNWLWKDLQKAVAVAARLGVLVLVGVGVPVEVSIPVGVTVGVSVGVGVSVLVAVGVSVWNAKDCGKTQSPYSARRAPISIAKGPLKMPV